jgi:hypothetical protein
MLLSGADIGKVCSSEVSSDAGGVLRASPFPEGQRRVAPPSDSNLFKDAPERSGFRAPAPFSVSRVFRLTASSSPGFPGADGRRTREVMISATMPIQGPTSHSYAASSGAHPHGLIWNSSGQRMAGH